jgi:hypothetical protein
MRGAVLLLSVAAAGCTIHLARNAPGGIDLGAPPRDPSKRAVETPADPGENVLMLNAGAFAGAGGRSREDDLGRGEWIADVGFELGAHWAAEKESHQEPDMFTFIPHPIPMQTHGVNVGGAWTGTDELRLTDLYAEYSRRERLWGWGAGYSYDPDGEHHGPHAQLYLTSLYARASWHFDRGAQFTVGVYLKLPVILTWSR